MNKINIELHDEAITQKGVDAIIDFYRTLAIDTLEFPGISAFVTGVNSSFLNVVIDTRSEQKLNQETILAVTDFFNRHQVPWVWLCTPLAKIHDLERHEFTLLEEAPGMYFDLTKPLPSLDTNIDIQEMNQSNNLEQWIKPINEGFSSSDDDDDSYRKLNADLLNKGENKLKHFVAYLDNQVAGAATLFLTNDAVMLHNLATREIFRNRGVGKALAIHRMMLAKKLGFKHCFLDASDAGYQVHKKLGFQVYCLTKAYVKKCP